jgi:hypothetical protein
MGKKISTRQKRRFDSYLARRLLRGNVPYYLKGVAGFNIYSEFSSQEIKEFALDILRRWDKKPKHHDEKIIRNSRFWDEHLRQAQAKRLEEAQKSRREPEPETLPFDEFRFASNPRRPALRGSWWG